MFEENSTPLVGDLVQLTQRKYLKAAAVRQNGLVPMHKLMQAACLFDDIVAGAHVQMIGVRQNNLRARLFQIARKYPLDRRLRTDGHVYGRFNIPVRGVQNTRSRPRFGIRLDQFK